MQTRSLRASAPHLLLALLLALGTGCGNGAQPLDLDAAEEDHFSHAVSHIVLTAEPKRTPAQARKLAYDVYAQLKEGRSFAELAETYSEHESKTDGGFIGFVPTQAPTRFSGAVQALEVGTYSRPVQSQLGYQIILRHSFEEGRKLEQKHMYAVYGFLVPWKGFPGGRLEKEEARREVTKVVDQLRRGETNLFVERERLLGRVPNQRADTFLFLTAYRSNLKDVLDAIRKLREGEYADPVELPNGFAVVQRRPVLRAIVKHILVSDILAPERPLDVKRSREQAVAMAKAAMAELGGSTKRWAEVVKKYTDDDTGERPGGMLGIVQNGDLPPSLEAAVLDTKPGTINSRIVASPRGLHILWRVQ
ncbi:MAG: peptidylprolyl isomerase [Planctomycetota bacterium]|nr:peptidylprolyl isomerase [Planctomycetota bacterium]